MVMEGRPSAASEEAVASRARAEGAALPAGGGQREQLPGRGTPGRRPPPAAGRRRRRGRGGGGGGCPSCVVWVGRFLGRGDASEKPEGKEGARPKIGTSPLCVDPRVCVSSDQARRQGYQQLSSARTGEWAERGGGGGRVGRRGAAAERGVVERLGARAVCVCGNTHRLQSGGLPRRERRVQCVRTASAVGGAVGGEGEGARGRRPNKRTTNESGRCATFFFDVASRGAASLLPPPPQRHTPRVDRHLLVVAHTS